MAHLKKLPTYYVKGDHRVPVYYTVDASELLKQGYVEEGNESGRIEAYVPNKLPEVAVEAGGEAFDMEDKLEEASQDLDAMTKAELMEYADEHGIEYKPAQPKAEILKLCKESES